ncbi:MAG: aminoacyl-tRNA hydrolase [Phycisphaeraceae bacterium]|nr:aminoacyl-tRNA hydrolase [Phycisphaerales bacterium]QOJ17664.1 MAG: aminoacyl-tRNA hydrolase [Phycisphaeraceae bacterium]
MTDDHDAQPVGDGGHLALAPGVTVPRKALRFAYSRSSGPGGQNVNKVNTKAEVRVSLRDMQGLDAAGLERLRAVAGSRVTRDDELVLTCDESRSQRMNREIVLERLRLLVVQAARPPRMRKKRRPSRAVKQRRLESKRRRGETKARRTWRDRADG